MKDIESHGAARVKTIIDKGDRCYGYFATSCNIYSWMCFGAVFDLENQ